MRAQRGRLWTPSNLALALMMAVLVSITGLLVIPPSRNWIDQRIAVWKHAIDNQTVCTAIGERRTVLLRDRSTMTLNTHTCVVVSFTDEERNLRLLDGEALFTVAEDSDRPFNVHTRDGTAQAVGTKFNVYRGPTGTTVTVIEGRVALTGALASTVAMDLLPGQQAEVTQTGEISSSTRRPFERVLDWPHGRATFQDEPLQDIVDETNRYRRVPMRIGDTRLAKKRFTIIVNLNDPSDVTDLLEKGLNIRVVKEANGGLALYSSE